MFCYRPVLITVADILHRVPVQNLHVGDVFEARVYSTVGFKDLGSKSYEGDCRPPDALVEG